MLKQPPPHTHTNYYYIRERHIYTRKKKNTAKRQITVVKYLQYI